MIKNVIKFFCLEDYEKVIKSIHLKYQNKDIILDIKLNDTQPICPSCNSKLSIRSSIVRKILHPIMIKKERIIIILHLRKYFCGKCKRMFTEGNPLSNTNVSYKGIEFLINQLRTTKKTFTQLSKECFVSKSSLVQIFDKNVSIKVKPLPEIISFDEVCVGNFSKECKYVFVMFDPIENQIIDIYKTRLKDILNYNFQKIPILEREKVKYVTMDGWDPYRVIVKRYLPNAKIALDSFHVLEAISRAMDKIRVYVAKQFRKHGTLEGQRIYRLLKDNRAIFALDWNERKWSKYWHRKTGFNSFEEFIKFIKTISIELYNAYVLKEKYKVFNKNCTYKEAKKLLQMYLKEFQLSPFKQYHEVATLIRNWFNEIINSFIVVNGQRLSTAKIERNNVNINLLDHNGQGYSNFERFRKRIMLFYNQAEINLNKNK